MYRYIQVCIDTWRAEKNSKAPMLRNIQVCFDTCFKTTDLYRYKHEFVSIQNRKNRLYVYFSFIHSSTTQKLLLPHTVSLLNPHPKIFNLPQNSSKFHKINTNPLRIHYPLNLHHQFRGQSLISFNPRNSSNWGLCNFFSKVHHQKCKVNRSTSQSSCNGT